MADISNVRFSEIKDISDSLEALSCRFRPTNVVRTVFADQTACSLHHDARAVLDSGQHQSRRFCLLQLELLVPTALNVLEG